MLWRIVPLMFIWPSLFAHTCHKWPKSNAIRHGQGTIGQMKVYQLPEQSWFVWLEILEGNPANGSEDNGSIRLLVSTFCQSPFDSARFMVQSSYWFWTIKRIYNYGNIEPIFQPLMFLIYLKFVLQFGAPLSQSPVIVKCSAKVRLKIVFTWQPQTECAEFAPSSRVAGLFTGYLESLVSAADIGELGRHCSVFPTSYRKILRYFPFI